MPYLIDGHNLIPKLGLNLAELDDEMQLINLLQEICRLKQTKVEIYFDGANPGLPSQRNYGRVIAHFIRKGISADTAIEKRLQKLDRDARNWVVVSSDQRVQAFAREAHARVISSDDFARSWLKNEISPTDHGKTEISLSPRDVDEWMELFKDPE